jgi:hypothetical protein
VFALDKIIGDIYVAAVVCDYGLFDPLIKQLSESFHESI